METFIKAFIKDYRQSSAEALGVLNEGYKIIEDGVVSFMGKRWQPDVDANQMLMVWEWLRDEADHLFDEVIFHQYLKGKDIKLATAKAFMEYQVKQQL